MRTASVCWEIPNKNYPTSTTSRLASRGSTMVNCIRSDVNRFEVVSRDVGLTSILAYDSVLHTAPADGRCFITR